MYENNINLNQVQEKPKSKKLILLFLILIIITIVIGGFYFWQKEGKSSYTQGYRLVNEKISQSAVIVIHLPKVIESSIAQANTQFYPEIEGEWLKSENKEEVVFKPKEKLKLNRYYSVQLTITQSEETIIKADFLAVEDPEIIAIFPKEDSEAPERSEITIVFNRPMVPLTTLGYLEEKDVPVSITPATQGRFKWITTRNLQFIPDDRLMRSSNYKVKVKSGLVSMDNLEVKGQEIEFTTRNLRYLNLTEGNTVYNNPISIYFNQPVDLEKTKKEISLRNNTTGKEISFIAEYASAESQELSGEEYNKQAWMFGTVNVSDVIANLSNQLGIGWPFQEDEAVKEANQSIIQVYLREDRFSREKFWDFENNYSLTINKAYPFEGDINLDEGRTVNISVSSVIKSITAESERTKYAEPYFFDPQGKIWVSFYEEVNLNKSKIEVQEIKDIGYGEKCKDDKITVSGDVECEKIPDKQKIYITFQSEKIGLGEKLEINFEKIVNGKGLVINKEPIIRNITSYPEFRILGTVPSNQSAGASLTEFVLCTNSPIAVPDEEDYGEYFKANLDYELYSWGNSRRIDHWYSGEKCQAGEFRTDIRYGLIPLSNYSLELKLEDVFNQKNDYSLSFTTGQMPSSELIFYHFQKYYNVTSPQKTKLTYAVRNMEYVDMEICKLNASDFLYYLEKKPSYYDPPSSIISCQSIVRDRIDLPERYWIKNYFQINIEDYFSDSFGHYILTFSHPNYRKETGERYRIYERSYLTVTDLAVAEKKIQAQSDAYWTNKELTSQQLNKLGNLYWVTNISNLEPVEGARVDLYKSTSSNVNLIFAGFYTTDNKGLASTDVIKNLKGAIISKGKDSTVIPSSESQLQWGSSAFSNEKIYLYTDKPIYQPSQEVFIKGIYRNGYDGNYEIYQGGKINLRVYNSRSDEISNRDLDVSDFGTFDTKIVLDQGAPLGMYRICAEEYACTYFDVQEYVPASFEVEVKTDKEEYISKDTVNLEVEANYYFGVPLEGGEITYTVSSQNYYFDRYSDGYFNFGSGWYYWSPYDYGDKFILRGKASLDAQGKAKISQSLDFPELFKNKEDRKSKIIVIDITVRNPQGRSVSSQKSFIVHNGEFYLGLRADKSFLGKNETVNIRVKSVDTSGKETRVKDITTALYKVNWVSSKRMGADGRYYYQWEKQRKLVKEYRFDTDREGNYVQELKIAEEGSYEIEASSSDGRGNLVWTNYSIYVCGKGGVSIRPTDDTSLEVEAEKTDLNVGDEGSIIIKSPYSEAKALISIERGEIFDYKIVDIQGNLYNYKFRVEEEYLPNVYVSVLLLSSEPEVKFGKVEFGIDTERKELNIEVKANKTHYLPGEEVILDIVVKDYEGRPAPAELSVAVVDLSVLALKGNPKKNPLIFFYSGFPLTISTASNIKDILVETEVSTKGGGGGSEETLAKKKRGVFKETAFWQAVVRTGEDGRAEIKFTLPDNLTTWQTETIGLTKDTKLGVDYQEFTTRKELMVVPLKPRFVVPGDVFYIGATIFNQSQEKQKLDITFSSSTLTLEGDDAGKQLSISPGESDTVYFHVQSPGQLEEGEHRFILSAKSEKLEDTVEQTIDITSNTTYEVTATSNYTTDSVSKEYVFLPDNIVKDKGEISIKSSATLAVFLSDALNYLLGYPYGCSEQIASKLDAVAVVQRGLDLPNLSDKFELNKIKYKDKEYSVSEIVEIGLSEIYNNQRWDGGFAYWREAGRSDFYLTLHVVETFHNLSLAGFDINQNSLNQSLYYLDKDIKNGRWQYESEDMYKNRLILTAYNLFKFPNFQNNSFLEQKLIQIAQDDLFLQEKISNTSLAYLVISLDQGFDPKLKDKVSDILDNRIDIDSRGAFLEMNKNAIWRYYETPVKNTSLYLKALVAQEEESPVLDKVLRWILNSRAKDGAWGSTNNTINVIDAFTDFLQWKRETESNFTLELLLNGKDEGSFDFNPETILDQFTKEIPLSGLETNKNHTIEFLKTDHNNLSNNLYYDLSLKYYLPTDQIPPRDEGFSIVREFYKLDDKKNENPVREAKVGDVLRGHLQITVPVSRNFVMIEDYIPAGTEIVNLELATEEKSLLLQEKELEGRELYPDFKEIHDDRVFLFKENLSPGVYEFDYYVRALTQGEFNHLPAIVSEMYFPENFGRTDGRYFEIK